MDRIKLLRNLVAMAAADGSFSEPEIELMVERAVAWGVEDPDLADLLSEVVANPESAIEIPDNREDCIELLEELVRMMAADGQLTEGEKAMFAAAAARMDITHAELDQLIADITRDL